MTSVLDLSLTELSGRLRTRAVSPCAVLESCLGRICAVEGQLHAYVRIMDATAREAARRAEAELAAGCWRGPLHGVPVAIKDLYDVAGVPTTASSKVWANHVAHADSAVVARLKAAGAVIVGKTHTHEFAYGGMTPTTRNPWDSRRTPGGSSGGSAATVASGGVFMATGTDTAGSIRIPSSLCGTVGLKPTFGRVSRTGVASLSWSLDHAGPITRTVEDAALCLRVMAGHDPADPASLDEPVPGLRGVPDDRLDGVRVGVPRNYFFEHVDPEVDAAVRVACTTLDALGATLVDASIPMPDAIMPALLTILMAEASAYHRRRLRATPDLFTDEVRTLLEAGELIPATAYIQAQRVRRMLQGAMRELYGDLDVLVAPAVPATAAIAGAESITWRDGTIESLASTYIRLTGLADLAGLPALGVPCGFSRDGLPIGLQVIGRPLEESTVVRVGRAYQRVTGWHRQRPPMGAMDASNPVAAAATGPDGQRGVQA